MRRALVPLMALLLGLLAVAQAQCNKCDREATVVHSIGADDVMLYVKVKKMSSRDGTTIVTAKVKSSVKGCVDKSTKVRLVSRDGCDAAAMKVGKSYLVSGNYMDGQAQTDEQIVLTVDACNVVKSQKKVPADEANYAAMQLDRCETTRPTPAPNKCPNKLEIACDVSLCNRENWCPEARSCSISNCGICQAQFFDAAGNPACTSTSLLPGLETRTCPGGGAGAVCKSNPCQGASVLTLEAAGCGEWKKAKKCVPNPCHLCQPMWVDKFGREVCAGVHGWQGCQDTSVVSWPRRCNGLTTVGYGRNQYGICQAVEACDALGIPLPATQAQCATSCECTPLDHVELGSCGLSLGYGVVGGKCVALSGCAEHKRTVDGVVFDTAAECSRVCGLPAGEPLDSRTPATPPPTPWPTPATIVSPPWGVPPTQQPFVPPVGDFTPPTIVCPGEDKPFVRETEKGANGMLLSYPLPVASDNMPGSRMQLLQGPAPGEFFPMGTTTVRYKVQDAAGLTAECFFTVTVTQPEDNGPPTSRKIPAQRVREGSPASLDFSPYFSDPDGDELVYFIADLPTGSGLDMVFDTGRLSGTPSHADATAPQPLKVRIMAGDGLGGRVIESVEIRVDPNTSNRDPVYKQMPLLKAVEGQDFKVDISKYFSDADGDELQYFVADLPIGTGLQLYQSGELSGVPTFADRTAPQPLSFRIMASDGKASVIGNIELKVTENPTNDAPQSSPIPDTTATQGQPFEYDLSDHFSDADQDPLAFYISGLPSSTGLKMYTSGTLKGTPSIADTMASQPLDIKILASDGKASTMQGFKLTVRAAPSTGPGGSTGVAFPTPRPVAPPGVPEPTITCPADIDVQIARTQKSVNMNYATPVGTPRPVLVSGPASGEMFAVGDTSVTWKSEDAYGRVAKCSFVVRVSNGQPTTDNSGLVIICPDEEHLGKPLVVEVGPADQGAILEYPIPMARSSKAGASLMLMRGPNSGEFFPLGVTNVVWRIQDVDGRFSECSFAVTVKPTGSPAPGGTYPGTSTRPLPFPMQPEVPVLVWTIGTPVQLDPSTRLSMSRLPGASYSLSGPPGFSIDSRTGMISGLPSAATFQAGRQALYTVTLSTPCVDDANWRDIDGDGCPAYANHAWGADWACNSEGYAEAAKLHCQQSCKSCRPNAQQVQFIVQNNVPSTPTTGPSYPYPNPGGISTPAPAPAPVTIPAGSIRLDARTGIFFTRDVLPDFGIPKNYLALVTFSQQGLPVGTGIQFNDKLGTFIGTPGPSDVGALQVRITARTNIGTDSRDYTIVVASASSAGPSTGAGRPNVNQNTVCMTDSQCYDFGYCSPTMKCAPWAGLGQMCSANGMLRCGAGLRCAAQQSIGICRPL